MNRHRVAVALLLLLVAAAGCVSFGAPAPAAGDGRPATVTRVVDGDTVHVRFSDGSIDTVRLLGVDAPETHGANTPAEFEGVPDTGAGRQCLAAAGTEATAFTARHLAAESVRVVTDDAADRRDKYGRLLAYLVLANGTNLDYRLVATGHARVYDTAFAESDRFYAAEARAQAERRGLWRCRSPSGVGEPGNASGGPLVVAAVHADAAGNDNRNLDDEYVSLRNVGHEPLDLAGYSVHDEGGHVYAFPDGFELAPNATVRLHTGSGDDTRDDLYWGADGAVWNNDGDSVVVVDPNGTVVARRRY